MYLDTSKGRARATHAQLLATGRRECRFATWCPDIMRTHESSPVGPTGRAMHSTGFVHPTWPSSKHPELGSRGGAVRVCQPSQEHLCTALVYAANRTTSPFSGAAPVSQVPEIAQIAKNSGSSDVDTRKLQHDCSNTRQEGNSVKWREGTPCRIRIQQPASQRYMAQPPTGQPKQSNTSPERMRCVGQTRRCRLPDNIVSPAYVETVLLH